MEKIFAGNAPAPDWDKLRPLLDEALSEMDERDRDVILLRFFDGRPFAEIGGRLRLTEGAARMRVERALAKLHAALARRGVTSTAAALGVALGQQVGAAVPTGLAATVTGGALAASAAGAGGWLATFMGMTKLQAVIAGGVVVAGTVGFISQATTNADLRREIAAQREEEKSVVALRDENRQLASIAAEVEALRRDDAEYQRLAQRVAEAQKASAENARLSRQRAAAQDLKAFQAQMIAEIDQLNREGNALVVEYKALMDRSKDVALTAEERAQAEVAAKQKLTAIQVKQQEVQNLSSARMKELRALSDQLRTAEPLRDEPRQSELGNTMRTMPDGQHGFYYIPSEPTDLSDALSAYEKLSRAKVIRDPSLMGARTTLDLPAAVVRPESEVGVLHLSRAGVNLEKGGTMSSAEAAHVLQTALRDQANVVLEPGADGTVVAKLGPPR